MADLTGPVWVVAEQTGGQLLTASLQIVGRARQLADQLGAQVGAILLGDSIEGAARQLVAAGADQVYAMTAARADWDARTGATGDTEHRYLSHSLILGGQ